MYQNFDQPDPSPPDHIRARLDALRTRMSQRNIDALLIPRSDAHQGEYVAACDERLAWLTGFTGSAGLAIVGREKGALLVDGRYTLQASMQVPSHALSIVDSTIESPEAWILSNLPSGGRLGFDPWLTTRAQHTTLSGKLRSHAWRLVPTRSNLVDVIWGQARPAPPRGSIVPHPKRLAGTSFTDKLAALRAEMEKLGEHAVVLTQPDSICWLLNVRGSDVAHNPVILAFAVVPAKGPVTLFTDPAKLTPAAQRHFGDAVIVSPPSELGSALSALKASGSPVSIDPANTPVWIAERLSRAQLRERRDPCLVPKAIKTSAEIAGARTAHGRDGAAMANFLHWFDENAASGQLDEITVAKRLEAFRRETGALREISFDTIAGAGPNGAIVHYRVTPQSNRRLEAGTLFLIDSGGQYQDGTTDITRTLAVGNPSPEMRRAATLVLKGHIAIATARFPAGTRGVDLDPLARRALWQAGLDYGHGTGHGVGSYLSVHEGPQSISKRGLHALMPGMLVSNEPGYYKPGAYGIRIENLVLVVEPKPITGGDRPMLGFETLTLAPIDRALIDPTLLSADERTWLDSYHARVADEIGPLVPPNVAVWLRRACRPL